MTVHTPKESPKESGTLTPFQKFLLVILAVLAFLAFYLFCVAVRERDFLEQKKIREELAVRGYSVCFAADGEIFIQKWKGESTPEDK